MTSIERSTAMQDALVDHYRFEREVGQGGMTTVYLAQAARLDRNV